MVTGSKCGPTAPSMRAILPTARQMATAEAFQRKEKFTRDGSPMILCKATAFTSLMMAGSISANLKTEKSPAKEFTFLKTTVKFMRANLRKMIVTAKEPCTTPMVNGSWVFGSWGRKMGKAIMNGQMAISTKFFTLKG